MTETKTWGPMTPQQHWAQDTLRAYGPMASKSLGVTLGVTTDAAGKLLNRLSERGIVARRADGRWSA